MNPTAILSAMITPAVLIAACAPLVLSTSDRTGKVVAQLRLWTEEYADLAHSRDELEHARRLMLFRLTALSMRRAQLLQNALMTLYVAIGLFVATSVAVGASVLLREWGISWGWHVWFPIVLGLAGGAALLAACSLLITEATLAVRHTAEELAFIRTHRDHATCE